MAVTIPPNQIQNLQQIQAVVAGPDDANRLLIIDGQFNAGLSAFSQGTNVVTVKEIFSVLVGPVLTKNQFVQANATASFTQAFFTINTPPGNASWQILGVDADWDDESGQVELRIEAQVQCLGGQNQTSIGAFGFHVTILAAVPTA
jgi:hypothetical protein